LTAALASQHRKRSTGEMPNSITDFAATEAHAAFGRASQMIKPQLARRMELHHREQDTADSPTLKQMSGAP
jgi:hypothetical protein